LPSCSPGTVSISRPRRLDLSAGEARHALARLAALPGLRAFEIVEYNPDRDHWGITAHLIRGLIEQLLPSGAG